MPPLLFSMQCLCLVFPPRSSLFLFLSSLTCNLIAFKNGLKPWIRNESSWDQLFRTLKSVTVHIANYVLTVLFTLNGVMRKSVKKYYVTCLEAHITTVLENLNKTQKKLYLLYRRMSWFCSSSKTRSSGQGLYLFTFHSSKYTAST